MFLRKDDDLDEKKNLAGVDLDEVLMEENEESKHGDRFEDSIEEADGEVIGTS
jgi:hypothetical protein